MSKNSAEKLKKLVKDLRHNELKLILNFAKRNSSGRKQELLERLNGIIESGCPVSLAVKINEMSKKRNMFNANSKPTSASADRDKGGTTICHTLDLPVECEQSKKTNEADKDKSLAKSFSNNKHAFASFFGNSNSVNSSSSSNENSSSSNGSLDIPFYPDVRFRHLPFYDFCDDLLKPIGMKDKNLGSKNNPKFAKYEFFLTPQQAKKIKDSQIMIDECMIEYGVQVLLRYCLLETTAEQDDNLPPKLCVHVNAKLITLPNFITPSHMGIEPKRPNRPLDITHACELNPLKPNFVSMTWVSDPVHNHCFSITLCKKLNCSTLLNRLKQNCSRHPDLTRALIKEKLAVNTDNEISFTCLKISLICPLGKTRLVLPCRSSNCSHLQCFDASTYLQMNDKKPTWVCPICDKLARYDSLIIDGLFIEILQKVKDTNEIQFLEDGNWKPIVKKQQNEGRSLDTSIICYEVPDSPLSGDSADTIVSSSVSKESSASNATTQKSKADRQKEIAMVDLTGDSDDDSHDISAVVVPSSSNQEAAKNSRKRKKSSYVNSKKSIIPTFVESSSLNDVGLEIANMDPTELFFGSCNLDMPPLDYQISSLLGDDFSNPPDLFQD